MTDLESFKAGQKAIRDQLQPLVSAISDAIFMFNDIEKARQLPAMANVQAQYVAMSRILKRRLAQSGLGGERPELSREEIFEIRCKDRATEMYGMLCDIIAHPDLKLPDDLRFEAGRLLSRIERVPGEGSTLTVHD